MPADSLDFGHGGVRVWPKYRKQGLEHLVISYSITYPEKGLKMNKVYDSTHIADSLFHYK